MENILFIQVPMFMKGKVGKKYKFKPLHGDIIGLIKNRLKLSVQNGYVNENGEAYAKYSIPELMEELNASNKTITDAIKHLEKIGHLRKEKGFNTSIKYYINHDFEQRLNEELLAHLEQKNEERKHSRVKTTLLEENNDKTNEINSRVKTTHQSCKNYTLERSTLKSITKKDIKTYTHVSEIVNMCRGEFVHLKGMEEDRLQSFIDKWEKAYNPNEGANLKTFIRGCMKDLNDRLNGELDSVDQKFQERYIERRQMEDAAKREKKKTSAVRVGKTKSIRTELKPDWLDEHKKESEQPKEEKTKLSPEEQRAIFEQATKKRPVKERLEEAISEKGYEHKDVVTGVMMLANQGDRCANEHLKVLQRKKCLFNGKKQVTYTAEYDSYIKSGSNMTYSEFLSSYDPL
ncbi:hypothetical protein COD70_29230, partial [Bacillus cereus]